MRNIFLEKNKLFCCFIGFMILKRLIDLLIFMVN